MKQLSSSELNSMTKEEMAAMILQMQRLNAQMQQTQLQLQQQVHTLTEKIALMNARHFGRSTEKLETLPGQMNIFNEAEVAAAEAIAEPAIEQMVIRKKKQKDKEDLSRLPKRIEKHELTKEQLKEIFGENGWKRLPNEIYSRVEYQPAIREVVEHHVAVYAAKKTDVDTIVRADRPVDLLRNSIATPSLVAAIMNAKYTNATPLYRIAQDFEQNDMILSRATMANWVIRCAERYLSLVYDRLRAELCSRDVLQVDETTCQVTKDGRSSNTKSYMFVNRTSEHCNEQLVNLYQYAMPRSRSNVQRFLKCFSGVLESDAFSGYKALDKEEKEIRAAFCWAHARRDYADALKALKDEDKKYASGTIVHKALVQIAAIYKADEAYKDKTTQERYNGRLEKVKPLVEAYFAWVREQEPATILSEKTRDGLKYSLNQEKYLKVFLEDGRIPIDNSATERAIRPFTVGRANWHIIDTVQVAEASAMVYSLVETAKANELKIYEYLEHLLTEIPKHMDDTSLTFLDDLLPWSENLPEECHKKI